MFDPDVEMPITQSRSTPMSNFTIEQLEALKEGTTPGPWITYTGSFGRIDSVGPIEQGFSGSGLECTEEDADLATAAPALADALIAEKQAHAELRKRIEERIRELKQPLCSHMPEGDELDDYVEQWDRQSYEAEVLTDILEDRHNFPDSGDDLNAGGFPW